MTPRIIKAKIHTDERGNLTFANDFKLDNICRFYMLEHPDTKIIRAWQGHKYESKYFWPIKGTFVVAWIKPDDFDNPSNDLKAEYIILNASVPEILHLPSGYANGLRALQKNSVLGIFSNKPLDESVADDFRYPADQWFNWHQKF